MFAEKHAPNLACKYKPASILLPPSPDGLLAGRGDQPRATRDRLVLDTGHLGSSATVDDASFSLQQLRKTLHQFVPSPRVTIPALHRGQPAMRQHELRQLAPPQKLHRDQRRLPIHFTKLRAAPSLLPITR